MRYLVLAIAVLCPLYAEATEAKSDFYTKDVGAAYTAGSLSFQVTAKCTDYPGGSVNDIVVGGGCWGSDTMVTFASYPFLGSTTSPVTSGGYTCSMYDSASHTLYARVVCKSASASGDSKSNYYVTSVDHSKGQFDSAGTYTAQPQCSGTDPVVSGGTDLSISPWYTQGFRGLLSQYPEENGSSTAFWYSSAYYTNDFISGREASGTFIAYAICKSGGSKSNYEQTDISESWTSTPSSPLKQDQLCSDVAFPVLSGGCWGTGIYLFTNAAYPQPNGAGNKDYFHCSVDPASSGQLGTRVLCQKN